MTMFFSDPLVLWYKPDSPLTPDWDGPMQIVVQDYDDDVNNNYSEGKYRGWG